MSTLTTAKPSPAEDFRVKLRSLIFAASGSLNATQIIGILENAKLETFRDDPSSNRDGGDD